MKMDKKLSASRGQSPLLRPAYPHQGLCPWTPSGLRPQTPVIGTSSALAMVRPPLQNLDPPRSLGPVPETESDEVIRIK